MATLQEQIPILDLQAELDELWDELNVAIQGVLRSGHFIMGPNVRALEEELAAYFGVRHAVALNSGTDALVIALRAMGIGPGDEVVTTPFTFFATAEAVSLLGATPVFADIEADTLNLDMDRVEEVLTERTRALIPVHLFGQTVEMDRVMELARRHDLRVLEDVAQAFGADFRGRKAGTIGEMGAFSFFPTKNLGAYGDGGLLVTDHDDLAEQARLLRAHGSRKKYHNEAIGYNSRLDEMQAAILRVKFPHVERGNRARREVAERYGELFRSVEGVRLPTDRGHGTHVWHQYTVRIEGGRRDAVKQALDEAGIGTMVYYPIPVHRLPVYAHLGVSLPRAEAAAGEVLSLPIWPQISAGVQERVVEAVRCALR